MKYIIPFEKLEKNKSIKAELEAQEKCAFKTLVEEWNEALKIRYVFRKFVVMDNASGMAFRHGVTRKFYLMLEMIDKKEDRLVFSVYGEAVWAWYLAYDEIKRKLKEGGKI